MFIKSQLFSHNKHVFFSVAFNTRNGRGALLLPAWFPVPRARIHEIPVHGTYYHKMDGKCLLQSPAFPSICLVYMKSPSNNTGIQYTLTIFPYFHISIFPYFHTSIFPYFHMIMHSQLQNRAPS